MPHILVGGDNQDAYLISEALEKMNAPRGQAVVFCATPHEVLSGIGRGGALAVVLNFEKAGLTNFELAYRIRESSGGRAVPLLLPEIDALGDVNGALGEHVGVFAFPVKPGAVAALACKLVDAAAPPAPARTAAAKGARGAAAKPKAAGPGILREAEPEALRAGGGAARPEAEPGVRRRRVRHRAWQEVRSPTRSAPPEPAIAETEPEPEPGTQAAPRRAGAATRRWVVLVPVGLVLAGLGYAGYRLLFAARGDDLASPSGAPAALVCVACAAREERPVSNLHDLRCRLCGGQLGFAFHCNDCTRDFGFVPPANIKELGDIKKKPDCAHCKSWNTKVVRADGGKTAAAAGPGAPAAEAPAKRPGSSAPPAGKAASREPVLGAED